MKIKNRYHASEEYIDFLSLLDSSYLETLRKYDAIDKLAIEERDLVSLRCGILEYEGQGTKTIRILASIKKISPATIWRQLKRIAFKLRNIR